MSEVINPCTQLSYPFQNRTASWMNNGVAPYAEAIIVSDGDLLPDGKTVKSYLSGKCTRFMSGFTSPGVRQCCNFYAGWLNSAGDWNFNGIELLKVRVLTNNPNVSITLYVMGSPWAGIASIVLAPGTFPVNSWFEIALDMRSGGASPTLLAQGKAVVLYVSDIGDQSQTYVLTEDWTLEPATGVVPLGCSIVPSVATVERNQTVGFTATAWGGTPPYTVEWVLNGQTVKTDTITVSNGSVNYNFSSGTSGTYQLFVRVTDSSSPQQTKDSTVSTIVVKAPTPPREPCRPLHVEGNLIKDDTGKTVHLHGINWHGWEDHPYGHLVDQNGAIRYNMWDVTIARQMLDGLVAWGVNCIRIHSSVSIWKGNYGNVQTNFQTLLTECLGRGIYVILDFYDVGYYNVGGTYDPVPWRPTNPDVAMSDVTGYSRVTWARQADVIPDIASFATFWEMIGNLLKNYPNIIFEFWNEPNPAPGQDATQAITDWFNATQQCINAVRSAGAPQLILTQWGYGVAYYPGQPLRYSIIPWVNDYASKLSDPQGNIVISTHCYRPYDGFGRWIFTDNHRGYTIADITEAFTDEFLPVAQTYPLIIGEIGANNSASDYANEMTAFRNAFDILGQNGVHYAAFWWFPQGVRALLSGPNYAPTVAGLQLIQAIQALVSVTVNLTINVNDLTMGTADPIPGTYQITQGNSAQVSAIPSTGYMFDHWELDGVNVGATSPYSVTMDKDHTLLAVFVAKPPPPPGKRHLTISSTTGGTTTPASGVWEYDQGSTAQVTATPNTGYQFKQWTLDGSTTSTQPTVAIVMDADHTLVAVFTLEPEVPPTAPTIFDRAWSKFEEFSGKLKLPVPPKPAQPPKLPIEE